MSKNILEQFRAFSDLSTDEISDSDVSGWLLPLSKQFVENILGETITVTNYDTGNQLLNTILAEAITYFAYFSVYHNHVETNTSTEFTPALFKFQIHYQKTLSLISVYKPRAVKYNERTGKFSLPNANRAYNGIDIGDSGT